MSNMVKLEDICDILDNQRKPLSSVIRAERIKNKSIDTLFPYYGATQQTGYIDDYIFDEELILLGEDGVLFYDKSKHKAYLINGKSWVNNHAHVLRVKKDKAVTNYILYYLNIFNYNGYVSGSTRLKLNKSKMSIIPIPLPTLTKQKEIASVLDKAQELISLRKESIKKLDELSKSIFIDMFGDPISNPNNWKVEKLKELSTHILSGSTPKGGSEVYVKEGIIFFRSKNVWKNKFIFKDIAYIDDETHLKMKKSSLKYKDILITKTGRLNTENSSLGRASLFLGKDNSANINGHVYLIRVKKSIIHEFLLFILTTDEYREYIRSICVGAIDKRQINKVHIADFPIILPPITEQNKFAKIIEKIEEQKSLYEKELNKLEENFKALLQKSFN